MVKALPCGGRGFFALKMNIAEKYTAERNRLEQNRSLDWSSYKREFTAAGELLQPLTVQNWFDLTLAQSAVITGDALTVDSVIDYVWRNSARHTGNRYLKEWRLYFLQRRVEKAFNAADSAAALIKVIFEHVKEAFDEFPQAMSGGESGAKNAMPAVTGEAQMLDEIAHRYGMRPQDVLLMPLRQAFALQRTIRLATIPEYKLLEPQSLRTIKSEYLQELNNGIK